MNREIKFRAKCKDNGDWVYGSYIANYNNNDWIVQGGDFFAVDSDTVGQFTCHYDKEGKEIYYGDIFYDEITNVKYVVYFSNNNCAFCYEALGSAHLRSLIMQNWWFDSNVNFQVIGNAYDNPELLENN